MKKFIKHNSLSLVFILLFLISFIGQVYFGFNEHNKEIIQDGGKPVTLALYFTPGISCNPLLKTGKVNFCRWHCL